MRRFVNGVFLWVSRLRRWLDCRHAHMRAKYREHDARDLWLTFWYLAEFDADRFLTIAVDYTASDRAWSRVEEWHGTDVDPGAWVARTMSSPAWGSYVG